MYGVRSCVNGITHLHYLESVTFILSRSRNKSFGGLIIGKRFFPGAMFEHYLTNLDESFRVGYHLNQHPVVPGHREVDLSVEELHYASDLLGNTTHQPMEETN